MPRHNSPVKKTPRKQSQKTTQKQNPAPTNPDGEVVKLLRELVEINKRVVEKIDGLGTKIDKIPDRIVEELYGNQTVRWGQLVLSAEIEGKGYEPALISSKELKFITAITKGKDDNKIDEVLIYEKEGERITLLMEGKHQMGTEEVQKAIAQMDLALGTAETFKEKGAKLGKIVPVFIFYTKSDAKPVEEHLRSIEKWVMDHNVEAIVILPGGELRRVGSNLTQPATSDT